MRTFLAGLQRLTSFAKQEQSFWGAVALGRFEKLRWYLSPPEPLAFLQVYSGSMNGAACVIKLMRDASSPKELKALSGEIDILSRLRHPHIVLILGQSTSPHCFALALI